MITPCPETHLSKSYEDESDRWCNDRRGGANGGCHNRRYRTHNVRLTGIELGQKSAPFLLVAVVTTQERFHLGQELFVENGLRLLPTEREGVARTRSGKPLGSSHRRIPVLVQEAQYNVLLVLRQRGYPSLGIVSQQRIEHVHDYTISLRYSAETAFVV